MSTPLWASVLIAHALLLNIQIFCIAEALILVFALAIAVLRGLPGPVLFRFWLLAVLYTDLFRGIPTRDPRTQQLLERIIAAGRL
jgi:ABC-type arginine transport system permease subunit